MFGDPAIEVRILRGHNRYQKASGELDGADILYKQKNKQRRMSSKGSPFFERNKPVVLANAELLRTAPLPPIGKTTSIICVTFDDTLYGVPTKPREIDDFIKASSNQKAMYATAYARNAAGEAERIDNQITKTIALLAIGVAVALVTILGIVIVSHLPGR